MNHNVIDVGLFASYAHRKVVMSDRVTVNGLQVAEVLYDFVNNQALPGTGVDAEKFWAGPPR